MKISKYFFDNFKLIWVKGVDWLLTKMEFENKERYFFKKEI